MNTAQVTSWGQAPQYMEAPIPSEPAADSNIVQVKLLAAGLHQVVRTRASGTHFTSGSLPHTPGVDGVGIIISVPSNPISSQPLAVGQTVYFITLQTGGSFSEILNVPATDMVPIPEGSDPIQIAALMNPAVASWMALRTRTSNLPKDFTVLIVGATSTSGSLAVKLARHLGASKVIGAARNASKLGSLTLDATVTLAEDQSKTDWSSLSHADVILDFVGGPAITTMLNHLARIKVKSPVQLVHVGALSGQPTDFPSTPLRAFDLTIRGSGPGSWSMRQLKMEMSEMVEAVAKVKGVVKFQTRSLKDVEKIWAEEKDAATRVVFAPEA